MSEIEYSDGARVETRIKSILQEATDRDSLSYVGRQFYDQWPVRYHLSPERTNLLRHLDFTNCDVLEIGAGMGAISRFLAENAKSLTVLEGTKARYEALCERLRDLNNWQGYVGNFEHFQATKKYDVVCVIGVLEYAELYVSGGHDGPYFQFLEQARNYLNEDGVLVLAIENKLGLKYWAGAPEDHTGYIFDGICDYQLAKSPRTFSRKELGSLLRKTGFAEMAEYYPFPDYKMCNSVLSAKFVEKHPDVASDFFVNQEGQRDVPSKQLFPQSLAAASLGKAGLLADFANSFLFVCSKNKNSKNFKRIQHAKFSEGELAWHYSLNRRYGTKTVFKESQHATAETLVKKQELLSLDKSLRVYEDSPLVWRGTSEDQKLSSGTSLKFNLEKAMYFRDWKGFEEQLTIFLKWSMIRWEKKQTDELVPEATDALWINAHRFTGGSNEYSLFDLEWQWGEAVKKSWFVFRNVFIFSRANQFLANSPYVNLKEIYLKTCERLSISPDFSSDLKLEAAFQSTVMNLSTSIAMMSIQDEMTRSLQKNPISGYFRDPQLLTSLTTARQFRRLLGRIPFLKPMVLKAKGLLKK